MNYILRRLVYLIVVVLGVSFVLTVMLEFIPGDPAQQFVGETATAEQLEIVTKQLGLDKPVYERYVNWLGDAVRFDFGESFGSRIPVSKLITDKLPVTLELAFLSQVTAVAFAIGFGLYTAHKPGGRVDRALGWYSQAMLATPPFVLAVLLVLLVSVKLQWIDIASYTPIEEDLGKNLQSMILPVLALSAEISVIYWRVLRADLSRTLREDYIVMAQAKGLPPKTVLFRHALRPSLFSFSTVVGITTAKLIGGTLIIEQIFGLPGIGRLLIDSIVSLDYPVVQGTVTFIALMYVVINTLVDVLYSALDPRVVFRGAE